LGRNCMGNREYGSMTRTYRRFVASKDSAEPDSKFKFKDTRVYLRKTSSQFCFQDVGKKAYAILLLTFLLWRHNVAIILCDLN
jgi:hypothetical protein